MWSFTTNRAHILCRLRSNGSFSGYPTRDHIFRTHNHPRRKHHQIMSTSIRNHLPGTIEQIVSDKVVSEIVINTAAGPVTSIITTGSVKRMNLKKGDAVFAIIKATEVSVEKESSSPTTTAKIRRRAK